MNNICGCCRAMSIKGKREDIMAAFAAMKWQVHIHHEITLDANIVLMRIELEDEYIDTDNFALLQYDNLKCIILMNPEESYTDVVMFKDFASSNILIKNAYTSAYGSIYSEELEGTIFFPDEEFSITYEDYSCGEMAKLSYNFSVREQWNNDNSFTT